MKKNSWNKTIFYVLAAIALTGCKADMPSLENSVYIAEAESEMAASVTLDEEAVAVPVTVRAMQPVSRDVNVSLTVDAAVLEAYNDRYTQSYELLPEEFYQFDKVSATIPETRVSADPFVLELTPLSEELLTSGRKFAVPVTVVSEGLGTLSASQSFVYLIASPILTDVVVFSNRNTHLLFPVDNNVMTNKWSFEFLLNVNSLNINNVMMFGMWTTTSPCNSTTHFKGGEWYHIAGVSDGKDFTLYVNGVKDNSIPYDGATIKLDDFYFGWTGGYYTIKLSELRLWSRALSANEISNNKYAVDPTSDGLVGYWKLNDKANQLKDATGKNPDGGVDPTLSGASISWESQKWK